MAEKDLRAIIEQVLMEMNLADNLGSAPKAEPASTEEKCADEGFQGVTSKVEEGELPDITQIDIRKQYLVENHHNAIIDKEDFKTVREIRRMRKLNTYPYDGYLVCPYCGKKLVRVMTGWGCDRCEEFYIPLGKLTKALLRAYEELDVDTADEKSVKVKELHVIRQVPLFNNKAYHLR